MHSVVGVCHRDLKPQNVLVSNNTFLYPEFLINGLAFS